MRGKILVCINNNIRKASTTSHLTIGKQYILEGTFDADEGLLYDVINDDDVRLYYKEEMFCELEDYREQKLNKLGI